MDSFSYRDWILPYSTLKTSSQPFGHGIPEFSLTICPILTKIFKNFHPQDFFCDFIHGLHLCDNFGAFNINIDDFIGKNSERINKNYPSISYIKVKTPKIE